MPTFYLDYELGNDANDGSSWAQAWQTITAGPTAARIAPGDIIRIAKSPAPASLGITGKWTNGPVPSTENIGSSTNATPIQITINGHGYSTGDVIQIVAHTTNTNANGAWLITWVDANNFTLDGSVGNGVGGATGTARQINAKAVVLASGLNPNVDRCEVAWTAANSATVARTGIGTDCKEGDACMQITAPASPATTTLYAYSALSGATDFSSYQKISLWIRNEVAVLATHWTICLCSDAAGATPVDTFVIPAIPSTGRWLPVTIARNGGGNLGASIQSIALYSGSVVPTASKYLRLDNIIVSLTSGLNLQSLVSKNSAAQGGTEGWYGLQSINGTIALLDQDTNCKPNSTNFQGYSGASETVTTYRRETIKTALAASTSTEVQAVQDSGTAAALIEFQGGYDTGTSTQDGETFFDGLNSYGYGIYLSNNSFVLLNYLAVGRYNYGLYFSSSNSNTVTTLSNVNNNGNFGLYFNVSNSNTVTTLSNVNNNGSYGLYFISSSNSNTVTTLSNVNNNGNFGLYFSSSSNNRIRSLSTAGNANGGINYSRGTNYVQNALIAESTEMSSATNFVGAKVFSHKHDQTADNHWIFTDGGTVNSEATSRVGGTGIMWKFIVANANRAINYPLTLSIAKIAVNASALVTVKAWMKKDHTTNVGAQLVCRGAQIAGVPSDVSATKANDTNWEELTITFTPSEAGVVEIEAWAYYLASVTSANVYVEDMTISQA